MANTGYINGSDLLLSVGGKAVGHCSSHKVTYNSETKERAVKPVASQGSDAGLWKDKSVTGLSITISADGLRFYDETENGFTEMSALWGVGQAVEVKCFPRGDGKSTTQQSYLEGKFVITSLEEDAPAQDDATYSINLENAGMPTKFPGMGAAAAAQTTGQ
jgi:predicted secreted protein